MHTQVGTAEHSAQASKDAALDLESNWGAMGEPSSVIVVPQTEYLIAFMVSD